MVKLENTQIDIKIKKKLAQCRKTKRRDHFDLENAFLEGEIRAAKPK